MQWSSMGGLLALPVNEQVCVRLFYRPRQSTNALSPNRVHQTALIPHPWSCGLPSSTSTSPFKFLFQKLGCVQRCAVTPLLPWAFAPQPSNRSETSPLRRPPTPGARPSSRESRPLSRCTPGSVGTTALPTPHRRPKTSMPSWRRTSLLRPLRLPLRRQTPRSLSWISREAAWARTVRIPPRRGQHRRRRRRWRGRVGLGKGKRRNRTRRTRRTRPRRSRKSATGAGRRGTPGSSARGTARKARRPTGGTHLCRTGSR